MNKYWSLLFVAYFPLTNCSLAQERFVFMLDTLFIVDATTANLANRDLSRAGSGDGQILWPTRTHTGGHGILSFDLESGQFEEIKIPDNNCISKSFTIRGLVQKGERILVWADQGLVFGLSNEEFSCIPKSDITAGNLFEDGFLVSCNYFRDQHSIASLVKSVYDGYDEVRFDPHHFELTRFEPNRLIDMSKSWIARVSVSKPILYIYDHALNLIDSVSYASDQWKDVDVSFSPYELKKISKKKNDFFEYYFALFDLGLSKNTNVHFLSDSLLVLGFLSGNDDHYYEVFEISKEGKVKVVSDVIKVGKGQCTEEDVNWLDQRAYEPTQLVSRGVAIGGSLYYVVFDAPTMPWGEPCEVLESLRNETNPERKKWLHIYRYSLEVR